MKVEYGIKERDYTSIALYDSKAIAENVKDTLNTKKIRGKEKYINKYFVVKYLDGKEVSSND